MLLAVLEGPRPSRIQASMGDDGGAFVGSAGEYAAADDSASGGGGTSSSVSYSGEYGGDDGKGFAAGDNGGASGGPRVSSVVSNLE